MKFKFILQPEDADKHKRALPPAEAATSSQPYQRQGTWMVRRAQFQNGRVEYIPITNFHAHIVRDLVFEESGQQRRVFTIEAGVEDRRITFPVSAADFVGMRWVLNELGPNAIIYPGQQQHARAAIQFLSGPVQQERLIASLGWIKQGPKWVYLHAAGALGGHGPVSGFELLLPKALQHFKLNWADEEASQRQAIRASLRCLAVAPDHISFPLLGAVYRAALGEVDFSVFITGDTGLFKTALAALCQQHFGAELDARRLPTSFASTAQAIQSLAFHAKDVLLVVDDFVPAGGSNCRGLESTAEQLFRSAGNYQGRSRMNATGRPTAPQPPRALLLATGEQVPQGQSIRARLLIIEVGVGDVNRAVLSECQSAAAQGLFASSMSRFLSWIAPQYEFMQCRLHARAQEIRSGGARRSIHARLPGTIAQLQTAWEIFLDFALADGAIDISERHLLIERSNRALGQLAGLQAKHQVNDLGRKDLLAFSLRPSNQCGDRGSLPPEENHLIKSKDPHPTVRMGKTEPAQARSKAKKKPTKVAPRSKTEKIMKLLRRPTGASISELKKVSGWQAHSLRGFLSGVVKKKMGLDLRSVSRDNGDRAYQLAPK